MSHTYWSSRSFFVTLSLNRLTACTHAQFSWCSSKTNANSETGQMAVYYQNLTLDVLSSRSALSLLIGALFKKFGLFLNTPLIWKCKVYEVISGTHRRFYSYVLLKTGVIILFSLYHNICCDWFLPFSEIILLLWIKLWI
jgi:hypothetical protein